MRLGAILGHARRERALAAGAVALAVAGIVLGRARGESLIGVGPGTQTLPAGTASRSFFGDASLRGHVALSQSAIGIDGDGRVYTEVELDAVRPAVQGEAPPVAIAVVLDVSGSMAGEKIEQAKRAVIELVRAMRPSDRVAVVTYSDTATTLVPLGEVGQVGATLEAAVRSLAPQNGTNIPAGLEQGAGALGEAPEGLVRRIVLVSDGLDTSGRGLGYATERVRVTAARGITASALGIGADYDERYLSTVAETGRGNYAFLAQGEALAGFLSRELREASTTSVEDVVVELTLPAGMRFVRVLGQDGLAVGRSVSVPVGALSAGAPRRIVAVAELDRRSVGPIGALSARIVYRPVARGGALAVAPRALGLRAVAKDAVADATRDVEIFARAESAWLAVQQIEAVQAWRSGDAVRATALAAQNAARARHLAVVAPSAAPALAEDAERFEREGAAFGEVGAGSSAGRALGLESNAHSFARARGRTP